MFHLYHRPERDKKEERDRGTVRGPRQTGRCKRNRAVIEARVGDRGDEKQGCQNRAVIGARVGDRGDATLPPR